MFRITLFSIISILMQATVLSAQQPTGIISGTVIEENTRQSLPGAHIRIIDLDRGEVSDTEGKFQFTDVPAGVYSIQISYMGIQNAEL